MGEHRIGVDLGGTKTAIVVLDAANRAVFSERQPTPSHDYAAIIRTIAAMTRRAKQAVGAAPATPVGVGIPGSLEENDDTVKNANTQALIGRPLASDLRAALGSPVAIANDATCFIASEAADGAASGAEVAFGVILGTGVGGGIAVSGRPLIGRNRLAGEWGHNPLPLYGDAAPMETPCYCDKTGCIEQYLCGPALSRAYAAATGEEASGEEIAARAAAGERAAAQLLSTYARNLARALSSVINLLDPDVIVLGGGLSNIDALYEATPKLWDRYVFNASPAPAPVTTRLLKNRWGDDSGLRGAAWLTSG